MTRGERDEWPEFLFLLGDQVYVDEGSPRTRERIRERRGTDTPPGEEVTDFEEYSLALRGVLERPADPLAALDRLGLDAVGRPRHERRLEHLPLLARGDAAEVLVAPPRHRGGDELLGLPAPRQPLAAGARRRRPLRPGARQRPRDRGAARVRRRGRTRPAPAPAGASAATSAAPGRSSWTRAPAGCWSEGGARSSTTRSGTGSSSTPSGDFDHLLIATTVPFLLSPGFHHLEAWSERVCDGAWGGLAAQGGREAAPRRRLRPLGLLRHVLPAPARAARRGRLRRARQGAGLDRRPLRRRPPRLPGRGRLQARRRG